MKIFGMQGHLAITITMVLRPPSHFIFVILVGFDTYNALAIIKATYSTHKLNKNNQESPKSATNHSPMTAPLFATHSGA